VDVIPYSFCIYICRESDVCVARPSSILMSAASYLMREAANSPYDVQQDMGNSGGYDDLYILAFVHAPLRP
jgi:hypothetical protein